nr:hypothetical protein GCM10020093_055650 [Planobispora longispora]
MRLPPVTAPRPGPLGLPVWRSSAWSFAGTAEQAEAFGEKGPGAVENPTVAAFAAAVASLEGAAAPRTSRDRRSPPGWPRSAPC